MSEAARRTEATTPGLFAVAGTPPAAPGSKRRLAVRTAQPDAAEQDDGRNFLAQFQSFLARFGGKSNAEAESEADEAVRIRRLATQRGIYPILDEDDLKYEGMQPLSKTNPRDKPLLDWVNANAADSLCIRVKRDDRMAWIITNEPASPAVEAAGALLEMQGDWDTVEVHPAIKNLVVRATARDQTLSPTEIEERFRELLRDAMAANASDIHFEMRGNRCATRFRINGEMQEVIRGDGQPRFDKEVIRQFGNYMFNRLAKRGARQFVTNTALNASAQMKVGESTVALRFSTAPDIRGVDIFVRIWQPDQKSLTLYELGYRDVHIQQLKEAIRRPYGVIVFSGPTGSGKSSSLTAVLDALEDEEKERRKIVSLEEPVERELEHVTHVSVSSIVEHGGWKALLGGLNRWDSNINVLGEIKDEETAGAIMDLATAGKLTLTTLHASNVLSIPARMEDLGVDHKLLYDANFLVLLVNQRLVPRLCEECSISLWDDAQLAEMREGKLTELSDRGVSDEEQQKLAADFNVRTARYRQTFAADDGVRVRGPGCERCVHKKKRPDGNGDAHSNKGTGIVGRVLVAEMVMIDERSRQYIRARDYDGWRHWLTSGEGRFSDGEPWASIRDHAWGYIRAGIADPADVEKLVCRLDEEEHGGTSAATAWAAASGQANGAVASNPGAGS